MRVPSRTLSIVLAGLALAQRPIVAQATGAGASPATPSLSPAALDSTVRSLVAALNSADDDARRQFATRLADNSPSTARIELLALLHDLHAEGAPFTLVGTERVGRGIFATVRTMAHPRLALLNVQPDKVQTGRLRVVEMLKSWNPAADSVTWPTGRVATGKVASVIDRNVQHLADAGAFSGVVLVASRDRVLLERGYGFRNLEDSVRNTPDSRITIASIGKMFTATAIGQLIEAGKLRLDDTLARVLPAYPNPDRARRITIRELLGHTAGLGDLFSDSAFDAHRDYPSHLALASLAAQRPLLFEPGSAWSYSNEGYVVLGAVIQQVSGMPYEDYLEAHVFKPAGMTSTGFHGADDVVPRRAVGYRHRDDDPLGIRPPRGNRTFVNRGSAAGGAYTTARDLWRFTTALREGRLVGAAMRDTLWTGRNALPWDKDQRYGFGAIVAGHGRDETIGHGGGGGGSGIDTEVRIFRDGRFTVVVLANMDPPAASSLTPALVRFLAAQ